jgi:hypothetical protein
MHLKIGELSVATWRLPTILLVQLREVTFPAGITSSQIKKTDINSIMCFIAIAYAGTCILIYKEQRKIIKSTQQQLS